MIIPDKKKMATMIVAQLHGGPEEEKSEGESGDSYEAIASDILSAISSGDAKALADALQAFHAECENSELGEGE